jgi:hypothetical protein
MRANKKEAEIRENVLKKMHRKNKQKAQSCPLPYAHMSTP